MHLTASPIDWYAARAGGIVAFALLTVVVLLGVTMAGKKRLDRWPRFALADVHGFGGLALGAFLVLHVGTIAIDSYLPFSISSLVVPLAATYKPAWTALGIVAAELLAALAIANRLQDRIGHRLWRRTHYLNFLVWSAAALHGIGSGTDRSAPWFVAFMAVSIASVVGATSWRILHSRSRLSLRRVGPFATAAGAASMVVWLALGPLHPGTRAVADHARFHDALTGQVVQDSGVTRGLVSLAGTGSGRQRVLVRADLLIAPQKLLSTAFQMEYLPSGTLCRGSVIRVHSYSFDASCLLAGGEKRLVHAQWLAGSGAQIAGGIISSHA
jgi:sulfoxide reductase heme-binding subunit YedZ